jgi:hypothetical protein
MLTQTKIALVAVALILTAVSVAQTTGQLYLADIVFTWLNR